MQLDASWKSKTISRIDNSSDEVPWIFILINTWINDGNNWEHTLVMDTADDTFGQILDIELDYLS